MATALEVALERLSARPIKQTTQTSYLLTLRTLGLAELPAEQVTVSLVTQRLNTVLSPGTRRKHAINVRACLGVNVPCPKAPQKVHTLPPIQELATAFSKSSYRLHGLAMLYAGLRIGESCVAQPLDGTVLHVDRQRLPDGTLARAKTVGPVYIPEWLAEQYESYDFNRSHNTVYVGVKRALKKAGHPKLTPHALRHAFATNLVKNGAPPEVLRRQMRHHDVAVSLRYYVQTTADDITDVVALLQDPTSATTKDGLHAQGNGSNGPR